MCDTRIAYPRNLLKLYQPSISITLTIFMIYSWFSKNMKIFLRELIHITSIRLEHILYMLFNLATSFLFLTIEFMCSFNYFGHIWWHRSPDLGGSRQPIQISEIKESSGQLSVSSYVTSPARNKIFQEIFIPVQQDLFKSKTASPRTLVNVSPNRVFTLVS